MQTLFPSENQPLLGDDRNGPARPFGVSPHRESDAFVSLYYWGMVAQQRWAAGRWKRGVECRMQSCGGWNTVVGTGLGFLLKSSKIFGECCAAGVSVEH